MSDVPHRRGHDEMGADRSPPDHHAHHHHHMGKDRSPPSAELLAERKAFLAMPLPEVPLTGIIIVDASQTIVKCNQTAEDLFVYPDGMLVGRPLASLIPKGKVIGQLAPVEHQQSDVARVAHKKIVAAYFNRMSPARQDQSTVMNPRTRSVRGLRYDGSTFVVEVHLQPNSRLGFVTAFVRDMTSFRDSVVTETDIQQRMEQTPQTSAASQVLRQLITPRSGTDSPDSELHNQTETSEDDCSLSTFEQAPNTENAADMHVTVLTMQLMYYCKDGNLEGVKEIVRWAEAATDKDGNALDAVKLVDYDQRTGLHTAASLGQTDVAKLLVQCRADPNALDSNGQTPLTAAMKNHHDDIVNLLRDAGGVEPPTPLSEDDDQKSSEPAAAVAAQQNSIGVNASVDMEENVWAINVKDLQRLNTEILGKGANGEVFLARWKGTKVAVKTMKTDQSDPQSWRDFKQEVAVMRTLRHPNVVQFFGACLHGSLPVIVTEFMRSGSLYVHLRMCASQGKVLDRRTVLKFALNIASGCCYLHSFTPPCIHRDIKPSNLLIDHSGNLKLGDFGLAKFFDRSRIAKSYNMTGETGTYRYMAPEVFRHEPYSEKVDQYSFAMVLWEMMEGESPFNSRSGVNAAFAAERGRRPHFSVKYHEGVQELISACWHVNPEQRPSFDAIVDQLEQLSDLVESMDGQNCTVM